MSGQGAPPGHELVVAGDDAELAELAAARMAEELAAAVAARGIAHVALSGGSTPGGAYRLLARRGSALARVVWWWVDERCVPPGDPRSNYGAARAQLLEPAAIEDDHVHRMAGDLGAEAGARDYAARLATAFGGAEPPVLDLVIAGVGNDGHTASLFPGTGAVRRDDATVIAVHPGGGLEPRVTLAAPVLLAARRTLVLASGESKRAPLLAAWAPGDPDEIPARLYQRSPRVTWMVDQRAVPLDR
ncbi:MAG: 6-phosphogluconolactonase [Polyangiaceae bacterium]|nr:6-phosphogluconolactonase [Polyangiaceae bacterium]